MAVNTTVSISRSNGGDNTRTTYAGSMVMAAQFYIPDASTAGSTNVKVSSVAGAPNLVLPKGAVVLSVVVTDAGAGSIDLGTRDVSDGTVTAAAIANGLDVSAIGTVNVGAAVTGTPVAQMAYVTSRIDTLGAGTVGGYLTYFVVDPHVGQQVV